MSVLLSKQAVEGSDLETPTWVTSYQGLPRTVNVRRCRLEVVAGIDQGKVIELAAQTIQIGRVGADAIDRGDEGDRDAGSELARIGQVFHHVNQPQHGANDADGRRIASGGFPDLQRVSMLQFIGVGFDFEDFAQLARLDAVDQQAQALFDERIGRSLNVNGAEGE